MNLFSFISGSRLAFGRLMRGVPLSTSFCVLMRVYEAPGLQEPAVSSLWIGNCLAVDAHLSSSRFRGKRGDVL